MPLDYSTENESFKTPKFSWKFFIPSLIGVLLFLIPFPVGGEWLIGITIMAGYLQEVMAPVIVELIGIVLSVSAVLSTLATVFKPAWLMNKDKL